MNRPAAEPGSASGKSLAGFAVVGGHGLDELVGPGDDVEVDEAGQEYEAQVLAGFPNKAIRTA